MVICGKSKRHLEFLKVISESDPFFIDLDIELRPICKYQVKIAQVHRLKSEQLSDVKIPFPSIYAS